MRQNDDAWRHEGAQGVQVEPVASDLGVVEPGQGGDFGRGSTRWARGRPGRCPARLAPRPRACRRSAPWPARSPHGGGRRSRWSPRPAPGRAWRPQAGRAGEPSPPTYAAPCTRPRPQERRPWPPAPRGMASPSCRSAGLGRQQAVDAGAADLEALGDGRGGRASPPRAGGAPRRGRWSVSAPCRRRRRAPWPAAMPSICRSRRRLVSNSANTPSMSRNALPAAVEVSIGCSVALSAAPLALSTLTTSCRSPMERASRSTRVTTSVSPARTKSSRVASSVRPSRVVPVTFSARTTSQPAAFSAACWRPRSWSIVH